MTNREKDFSAQLNENYNFASSYGIEQIIKLCQISVIFLKEVHGNKILDLGCGGASFIKFYVKRYRGPGFKEPLYLGIDINKKYIDQNNEWLSKVGGRKFAKTAKFIKADIENENFWNKLAINKVKANMVIASEIVEHLDDRDLFLKRCYDVVADDGILVISTPVHRNQDEGIFERNKIFHEFEYYCEDFFQAIRKHFIVCSSFGSLIKTEEFKMKLRRKYPDLFKLYNQLKNDLYFPPALLISIFKLYTSHLDNEFENLTVICKRRN